MKSRKRRNKKRDKDREIQRDGLELQIMEERDKVRRRAE
jgi:hypothetical protein